MKGVIHMGWYPKWTAQTCEPFFQDLMPKIENHTLVLDNEGPQKKYLQSPKGRALMQEHGVRLLLQPPRSPDTLRCRLSIELAHPGPYRKRLYSKRIGMGFVLVCFVVFFAVSDQVCPFVLTNQ